MEVSSAAHQVAANLVEGVHSSVAAAEEVHSSVVAGEEAHSARSEDRGSAEYSLVGDGIAVGYPVADIQAVRSNTAVHWAAERIHPPEDSNFDRRSARAR